VAPARADVEPVEAPLRYVLLRHTTDPTDRRFRQCCERAKLCVAACDRLFFFRPAAPANRRFSIHFGAAPSISRRRFIDFATSSETLSTATLSPALRSCTPSWSMIVQKGQAVATVLAPDASTSSMRLWLTRVPIFSSIHMRPPPAPQQNPCCRLRG